MGNNSISSKSVLSIDVEDWFHILDSPVVPRIKQWDSLESRIEQNIGRILVTLDKFSVKATFFWLGWMAERFPQLVRQCQDQGHEIASHGYGHVLAYEIEREAFREDLAHAKDILEDITGEPVRGFRAAGFGITNMVPWAFDVIRESGYQYDSSVFPASRGHGGMSTSPLGPYFIETGSGPLLEVPMSVVEVFGRRMNLFGGGYLRIATKRMIRWGITRLQKAGHPLIVYVHPREVDPDHPRLPLSLRRRFKCYVNLKGTMNKLRWLCLNYSFCTMHELVKWFVKSFYFEGNKEIPVVVLEREYPNDNVIFRPVAVTDRTVDSYRHYTATQLDSQEFHLLEEARNGRRNVASDRF